MKNFKKRHSLVRVFFFTNNRKVGKFSVIRAPRNFFYTLLVNLPVAPNTIHVCLPWCFQTHAHCVSSAYTWSIFSEVFYLSCISRSTLNNDSYCVDSVSVYIVLRCVISVFIFAYYLKVHCRHILCSKTQLWPLLKVYLNIPSAFILILVDSFF